MKARLASLVCAALLIGLPCIASAQALQCTIPARIETPEREDPPVGEARNIRPSQYMLALSWSPQFCRDKASDPRQALQCGGVAGKFGFILHGLWPDVAGRDDPAWCGPAKPLPQALIRRHLCMTPSLHLMQHEWAKHGTCVSSDPEKYFRAAGLLFDALKFPDMNALSRRPITISAFMAAFSRLNPGIRPEAMAVNTDKGGWLKEVRLCLDLNLKPRRCSREDWGTKPSRQLKIWRGE